MGDLLPSGQGQGLVHLLPSPRTFLFITFWKERLVPNVISTSKLWFHSQNSNALHSFSLTFHELSTLVGLFWVSSWRHMVKFKPTLQLYIHKLYGSHQYLLKHFDIHSRFNWESVIDYSTNENTCPKCDTTWHKTILTCNIPIKLAAHCSFTLFMWLACVVLLADLNEN